jgi:hypothetical protein
MTFDNGEHEEYKANIINDKFLTPFMVNMAVMGILAAEERSTGNLSLSLEGDIFLENGTGIHLDDLFSGNFDSSITDLSSIVFTIAYFLNNNEFRDLSIHKIDLNIHSSEDVKYSYLEKVWLDKYDVSPGELIQVKIYTRNYRGQPVVQDGVIPAPRLPSGSEFQLVVADAASLRQLEALQYRTQGFVPRNLNQLIRVLSNLRKNNRIYLKVIASKPGLFLKGEEMPNLPPTMKTMFSSPRAAISSPTELKQSTLIQYQLPVPYVFRGAAVIPIKIK